MPSNNLCGIIKQQFITNSHKLNEVKVQRGGTHMYMINTLTLYTLQARDNYEKFYSNPKIELMKGEPQSNFELNTVELLTGLPQTLDVLVVPTQLIHCPQGGVTVIVLPTPQLLEVQFGQVNTGPGSCLVVHVEAVAAAHEEFNHAVVISESRLDHAWVQAHRFYVWIAPQTVSQSHCELNVGEFGLFVKAEAGKALGIEIFDSGV